LNSENLKREISSLKKSKNNFLVVKNISLSDLELKKIPENIRVVNWLDFL